MLELYMPKLESIDTLHFLTDGPFSQYKNQFIFYLFTQILLKKYPQIKCFTHNYKETHHGKDEIDGIGGYLKRTGDDTVKYDKKNIPDFDTFISVLQSEVTEVLISTISSEDIAKIKSILNQNSDKLKSFKGTSKVHQFTWDKSNFEVVYFNSLSCFECEPGTQCIHYHLGKLDYSGC